MMSEFQASSVQDQEALDGTPAHVVALGGAIDIRFQCGPIADVGVNGTTIEAVALALGQWIDEGWRGRTRSSVPPRCILPEEGPAGWSGEDGDPLLTRATGAWGSDGVSCNPVPGRGPVCAGARPGHRSARVAPATEASIATELG
jgi:hypothetical protein